MTNNPTWTVEEVVEVLQHCQKTLAMMVDPKAVEQTTVLVAYSNAVEAETRARSLLSKIKEQSDG